MPIFEYRCADCQTRFERLVRAGTAVQCPMCESGQVVKQLSVIAKPAGAAPALAAMGPGACGTCGHPDGPGACRFDD